MMQEGTFLLFLYCPKCPNLYFISLETRLKSIKSNTQISKNCIMDNLCVELDNLYIDYSMTIGDDELFSYLSTDLDNK